MFGRIIFGFLIAIGLVAASEAMAAQDCRQHIATVTCVVEPAAKGADRKNRPCLGGEAPYIAEIQKAYDEVPQKLKPMFCSLKRIYIETDFRATAYASVFTEEVAPGKVRPTGFVLGFHKDRVFDNGYDLTDWTNRKEQLNFGRAMEENLHPDTPKFYFSFQGFKSNPLLFDVIIHEFGHFLDFVNEGINDRDSSHCFDENKKRIPGCLPKRAGKWAEMSWIADRMQGKHKNNSAFWNSEKLCFYGCRGKRAKDLMTIADSDRLYREFHAASSFATTYAANNSADDFAEGFTSYILDKYAADPNREIIYSLNFKNGESLSMFDRWNHGVLRQKKQFLDDFYNSNFKVNYDIHTAPVIETFVLPQWEEEHSCTL